MFLVIQDFQPRKWNQLEVSQAALRSEAVGAVSGWGSGGLSRSPAREESLKSQQKVVVSSKDSRTLSRLLPWNTDCGCKGGQGLALHHLENGWSKGTEEVTSNGQVTSPGRRESKKGRCLFFT